MKLTTQRLFDFASIAATKAGTEIRPLVDYVNSSVEQLIRAVTGQLTLADNIKGQIITSQLVHGVASTVAVDSRDINGIITLKVESDAMDSFAWSLDARNNLLLTAYFKSGSGKRTCKFFVFFQ